VLLAAAVVLGLAAGYMLLSPDSSERRDEAPLANTLDATLESALARTATPGAQAAIVQDGEVLWSGSSGDAEISSADGRVRPVDDSTVFTYASFGKQILSAYTLSLVERGELDLDLPISGYLGDGFPGGEEVTALMLLNHTAGYPDLYSTNELEPLFGNAYDPDARWDFERLLPGIKEPVDPGIRWQYSNTGYIVLLRLVEQLTEGSLSEAIADFVSPAGVSGESGDSVMTVERSPGAAERFAHGYYGAADTASFTDSFEGAETVPTDLYGSPFGDGAFAGTALAAAAFLDSLFVGEELLDNATVKEMTRPVPSSGGYGLGSFRIRSRGRTWQGHDGSYGGFTSTGFTDRERGLTVFVVTNKDDARFDPAAVIWRDLVNALEASEKPELKN
jgi:CubicO group peptidase (beta-lactamase class C family)